MYVSRVCCWGHGPCRAAACLRRVHGPAALTSDMSSDDPSHVLAIHTAGEMSASLLAGAESLDGACLMDGNEVDVVDEEAEEDDSAEQAVGRPVPQRLGKGRPHLRESDKLRIMYLIADWFRETPDPRTWKRAAEVVAQSYSVETGIPVATSTLKKMVKRFSKPVSQWKVIPPRGRVSTITNEFKEQVAFVLADPDIPAEKKSLRKITEFLPDCNISKTTLRRVFIEMKKDKLMPKPAKPARRHKPKAAATVTDSHNGHS